MIAKIRYNNNILKIILKTKSPEKISEDFLT